MCFSATVSFSASAVIGAAGVASIIMAKHTKRKMFAAIPLIFAIQQFFEGIVWITSMNTAYAAWHNTAMYFFLVFAQVVWPVWVPLSILLLENESKRRFVLTMLLGMGISVALYLGCALVFLHVS